MPSGVQGLQWVYPDFKQDRAACRPIARPLSPRKVLAYFCPFTIDNPNEGIRYSEWDSAASAREVIGRDFYWPETAVERDGYTWSVWIRESGDEQGCVLVGRGLPRLAVLGRGGDQHEAGRHLGLQHHRPPAAGHVPPRHVAVRIPGLRRAS